MFKAKYIIVNRGMTPIIFPETLSHAEMAHPHGGREAVSGAGFVYVNAEGAYVCYGESVTLKVKSNGEEDSATLNRYLGGKHDYD